MHVGKMVNIRYGDSVNHILSVSDICFHQQDWFSPYKGASLSCRRFHLLTRECRDSTFLVTSTEMKVTHSMTSSRPVWIPKKSATCPATAPRSSPPLAMLQYSPWTMSTFQALAKLVLTTFSVTMVV